MWSPHPKKNKELEGKLQRIAGKMIPELRAKLQGKTRGLNFAYLGRSKRQG